MVRNFLTNIKKNVLIIEETTIIISLLNFNNVYIIHVQQCIALFLKPINWIITKIAQQREPYDIRLVSQCVIPSVIPLYINEVITL